MTRPRLFWLAAALLIALVAVAGIGSALRARPVPAQVLPTPGAGPGATPASPTPSPLPSPPSPTPAPPPAERNAAGLEALARAFPTARAMEHLRVLTSDELDGRRAGTEGGRKAADYIAARLEAAGIEPLLEEGYFQPFPLTYLDLGQTPVLERVAPQPLRLEHRRDFRENVFGQAGGGQAEGKLVVAGYGGGRSPFLLGEVQGRPVLAITGGQVRVDQVLGQAVSAGAGALILGTRDPRGMDMKFSYIPPLDARAIPMLTVSEEALDRLLEPAGLTVEELVSRVRSAGEPFLEGTEVVVRASLPLIVEERESQNVLGVLPGSDPELADEYVIIGGHYDHVGRDPDGTLFQGANDNASGTAITLALAEHWQGGGFRPARSVIFALWGAEEAGLVGSEHFVAHPPVPLSSIVGFINLDAVGQADGERLAFEGGPVSRELIALLTEAAADLGLTTTSSVEGGGGSDHQPFVQAGVPAAIVIWEGFAGWIHVPRDTFENASPEKIGQVGQLAGLAGARLASGP